MKTSRQINTKRLLCWFCAVVWVSCSDPIVVEDEEPVVEWEGNHTGFNEPYRDSLLFSSNRNGGPLIWIAHKSGGVARPISDSIIAWATAWSPRKWKFALAGYEPIRPTNLGLYVCDYDGSNAHRITPTDQIVDQTRCEWSPNGEWIAYLESNELLMRRISIIHPDGSEPRALTDWNYGSANFSWMPNSTVLLHVYGHEVTMLGIDGSVSVSFSVPGNTWFLPRVSPDGQFVAFSSERTLDNNLWWNLCVYEFTSKKSWCIDSGAVHDFHPSWSSDSRQIAFDSRGTDSGPPVNIMILNLADSSRTQVTDSGWSDRHVAWYK